MKDKDTNVIGKGTLLRGNFAPRGSNDPSLAVAETGKSGDHRLTEDYENAAREKIGGSIAFVTKLKDSSKDVLFWDGEED